MYVRSGMCKAIRFPFSAENLRNGKSIKNSRNGTENYFGTLKKTYVTIFNGSFVFGGGQLQSKLFEFNVRFVAGKPFVYQVLFSSALSVARI